MKSDKVFLKDYIAQVFNASPNGDIRFTINLNPDTTVAKEPTGNSIEFVVLKYAKPSAN